jgi:hypothetical protein
MTGTTVMIIHSGLLPESRKRVDQLDALHQLLWLQFASGFNLHAKLARDQHRQINRSPKSSADGLSADHGGERVRAILIDCA